MLIAIAPALLFPTPARLIVLAVVPILWLGALLFWLTLAPAVALYQVALPPESRVQVSPPAAASRDAPPGSYVMSRTKGTGHWDGHGVGVSHEA